MISTLEQVRCGCGCGATFSPVDRLGRPRRYVRGHAVRGVSTKRKSLKIYMPLTVARRIAGALGAPRKMPGWSYGLDAFKCLVGSWLAKDPTSTCADCFARRDLYKWRGVREAHAHRMKAIEHPKWVPAMVELISHHCIDEPWFRWHDSGDLMSLEHFERICDIASKTPKVIHWLPTREYGFVSEYLEQGGIIPKNLIVRLSSYYIGKRPDIKQDSLKVLPTSTTHNGHGTPISMGEDRRSSIECKAYTRGNRCKNCRACWDPRVQNVSFSMH